MFCSVIAPHAAHPLLGYENYVELLERAGSDGFRGVVAETLRAAGVNEFAAYLHNSSLEPPVLLISNGDAKRASERAEAYRLRYFRVDPLKRLFDMETPRAISVTRIRGEDINNHDYRRTCFTDAGYLEKLLILHKVPDGWVSLNLFRQVEQGAFSGAEVDALSELAQMVMPIIATHCRLYTSVSREKPLSISDIEMRVRAAFPGLSGREHAVCARTLAGVTAEGIAIDLGIKQTTVLTYRRRAYERLNINSVHQMSTMLIR